MVSKDTTGDDLFSKDNVPESNWFKFDKIGARVGGTVMDMFDKAASGDFGAQRVFVLKQSDGSMMNVGIKSDNDFLMGRTNMVQVGDRLGFEFEKEIPAKVKGHHPAKSIVPYHVAMHVKPVVEGKTQAEAALGF